MASIMDQLHQDHRNLARVLTVIEQQLLTLRHAGEADFALLNDALDYVEHYPDLVHHPREDLLFERYLANPAAPARHAVERLSAEHRELKAMTEALRSALEAVLQDTPLEREPLVAQLETYVERQRRHIDTEEAEIFPLLLRELREEDWQAAEEVLAGRSDPLFGGGRDRPYEALYQRLLDTPEPS